MAATVALGSQEHPVTEAIVERINRENRGWRAKSAAENKFAKYSVEEIRGMMGLVKPPQQSDHVVAHLATGDLPDSFDMRTAFPDCVYPIRDQGQCGSCWAFAGAETLTTNLCTMGTKVPELSEQEIMDCAIGGTGCGGLSTPASWYYFGQKGVRSEACVPFAQADGGQSLLPCPAKGTCAAANVSDATVYKCPTASSSFKTKDDIKAAIMQVGEVNGDMIIFGDFMNYEGGIFRSGGAYTGQHAVTLIGWGVANGTKYWTARNSWGTEWGEDGYFRIAMGDMSTLGSDGTACIPKGGTAVV